MWRLAWVVALVLLVAACSDDGSGDATTTTAGDTPATTGAAALEVPTIGMSSSVQPSYILAFDGPLTYGSEFGLPLVQDDIVSFDSHATVVQAALGGEVDIVGASTLAHLAIIDQGQPFKIFSPMNHADTQVFAGRGDVNSVEQFLDPEVAVALDEPGGAGAAIADAMLMAVDAGFLSSEIPGAVIIGSSGGRTSALAAGEADATAIHIYQADGVNAETGDVNIIATLYESVPVFAMQSYSAPESWIEENMEEAAAFTASIILSARNMHADFETYKTAVETYIPEPPTEETLQAIWDLATTYDFWPLEGGLEDERMQFMIDLGVAQGLIEEGMTVDEIVDRRPLERALEMLGD